jgi:hypothetical protein
MTDFSIYLNSIGNDSYQVFIKNEAFDSDFIRIIIGFTEMTSGKRVGKVNNSWIISPLKPGGEHVFIQQVSKPYMSGKQLWVALEAVKRNKPKNKVVGCFMALSPNMSKWRKTVGSSTYFTLKPIDSLKRIEQTGLELPSSKTKSISP